MHGTELGIDFTSENINNINDMISHIKSVNKDYNIITVFLYLSEQSYQEKNESNKCELNFDINNMLNKIF